MVLLQWATVHHAPGALGEEGAVEGWQEGRPTGRAHTPTRTRERREARRGQPPPANKRPVAHQGHGRWQSDQHTRPMPLNCPPEGHPGLGTGTRWHCRHRECFVSR